MAVLQSTNVQGSLCVNGVAVGGGKDFKYCCFTASTTWTPSQDLVDGDGAVEALVAGGGGGSGAVQVCLQVNQNSYCAAGAKGSGGGGAVVQTNTLVDIDSTSACTVTVGAGGDGAVAGEAWGNVCNNASIGGCSSFAGIQVGGGGGGLNWCTCPSQGNRCNAMQTEITRRGGGNSLNGGTCSTCALGGASVPYRSYKNKGDGCYQGFSVDQSSNKSSCGCASQYQTNWNFFGTPRFEAAGNASVCGFQYNYSFGTDALSDTLGHQGTPHNGEELGAGGNSNSMGGVSYGCGTSSADISCCYVEINNAPSAPTGCRVSGDCDCSTTQWYLGDGRYGSGAPGLAVNTSRNATGASNVGFSGMKGQDGIVIIKWFE